MDRFMEKLRKWMAIMALVGTVLVTAVFCYMPFREMLKERNKEILSLQEEKFLAASGEKDKAAGYQEGQEPEQEKEVPGAEEAEAEQELAVREALKSIAFSVPAGEEELEIKLWRSEDDSLYLFVPGFAREEGLHIRKTADRLRFAIGDKKLKEGDELRDIRWEQAYQFSLYDKDGVPLLEAPLYFVDASDMPVISLATESGELEWISEEKGNEEPGELAVYDETGALLFAGEAESISGRGNSTWGLPKKPFQVKLKEKADLFGYGEAENWNLLAEGYDETKLRNLIAMGLARELGMAYVPEGRLVLLYCNGGYYGLYYFSEAVEVEKERVAISDLEDQAMAAYSSQDIQGLTQIVSEDGRRKWTSAQVEKADLTGGYLIERELPERFAEEASGFMTRQGDVYALKSPKYATEDQVNYIAELMQEFQDALEEEDGINQATGKHYSEYIDMESFVQKYLVEEITKNYDGGVTSSYFYKPSDAVSERLYAGPVWDYDVSFGNCDLDEMVSDPMGITRLNDHVYGTEIFALLYEKEEFYNRAVALYEEKALPYLDGLLAGGIDAMAEQISQAAGADSVRWAALQNRYQYYESYENNIRYLKYFIEARRDFLNEVWLSGEIYHCVTFLSEGAPFQKRYVKDGALLGEAPVPPGHDALFAEWQHSLWKTPFDRHKPIYEDMCFEAVWQELSDIPG